MNRVKNWLYRSAPVALIVGGIASQARATGADFDYTGSATTLTTGVSASGTGATQVAAITVGILIFGLIIKYTRKAAK